MPFLTIDDCLLLWTSMKLSVTLLNFQLLLYFFYNVHTYILQIFHLKSSEKFNFFFDECQFLKKVVYAISITSLCSQNLSTCDTIRVRLFCPISNNESISISFILTLFSKNVRGYPAHL